MKYRKLYGRRWFENGDRIWPDFMKIDHKIFVRQLCLCSFNCNIFICMLVCFFFHSLSIRLVIRVRFTFSDQKKKPMSQDGIIERKKMRRNLTNIKKKKTRAKTNAKHYKLNASVHFHDVCIFGAAWFKWRAVTILSSCSCNMREVNEKL